MIVKNPSNCRYYELVVVNAYWVEQITSVIELETHSIQVKVVLALISSFEHTSHIFIWKKQTGVIMLVRQEQNYEVYRTEYWNLGTILLPYLSGVFIGSFLSNS